MTTACFEAEIGTVEVSAEDATAASPFAFQFAARFEKGNVLLMPGDGGRGEQTGGAMSGVCPADGAKRFRSAVHEVGIIPAVDMQIDEPRRQEPAAQIDDLVLWTRCSVVVLRHCT